MALLCDSPRWPAHGTVYGHLVSDHSLDELHDFAAGIGMNPRSFDHDHYDLARERLDAALTAGAQLTPERQLVARVRAAGLRIAPDQKVPSRSLAHRMLVNRWQGLLPQAPDLGEDLLARYVEPQRHYHDVRHLAEMVTHLDELAPAAHAPRVEELAAWFHDAVWHGVAGSDEEQSAQLAERELTGLLDDEEVTEVARLVRLTATHSPQASDVSGARVCDADLAILGSAPGRYQTSVRDIRLEFGHFTNAEWRTGRGMVLERFLDHDHLFTSSAARQRWEASARKNIGHELTRLAVGVSTGL
ncbi:MAG TPA: DUF4031 domain-containing protein [Candidatus Luteococcus avicola]|nr:DUF4031 domain-containing protein [Candidatus Luteococcus avicola]